MIQKSALIKGLLIGTACFAIIAYLWPSRPTPIPECEVDIAFSPLSSATQQPESIEPPTDTAITFDDKGGNWHVVENISGKCKPDEGPAHLIKVELALLIKAGLMLQFQCLCKEVLLMNGLFLSRFVGRFNVEKKLKPVAISWMVGVVIAGAAQMAGAAFTISTETLQSTEPCSFAEQLHESASIRNQYTAKLVAALNRTASASNSFENMNGNITPASYREGENGQTEPTVNSEELESKQAISTTGIDRFSVDCLGCHDGARALSITTVFKNNPFKGSDLPGSNRQMIGMDHPIGMDYDRYASASKEYKPLFGVSNKMVFVNGKVGCLTCHNPLLPEKGHLVMSDRDSALCLTCHND